MKHPYTKKNKNRHECATSNHAFNATICHIVHSMALYVCPTYDKIKENSKFAWMKNKIK
jgi:cytochrome c oxidase assembly factor CtaG